MSDNNENERDSGVATISKSKIQLPKKYKVIMHNDDYTTMEFVIFVLKKFFGKSGVDAESIMFQIHEKGAAICGVYTREIAESKADKVMKSAENEGHPLRCSVESE